MPTILTAAQRSALLADCETPGPGIRPHERRLLLEAPQIADYRLDILKEARIANLPPADGQPPCLVIVLPHDPFATGIGAYSVDLIERRPDGRVAHCGWIIGDRIWTEAPAGGRRCRILARIGEEVVTYGYDLANGRYLPLGSDWARRIGRATETLRAESDNGRRRLPRPAWSGHLREDEGS
ncbi:MAG: hypothetical protein AAF675_01170 [Pseudomonadota bacterium]